MSQAAAARQCHGERDSHGALAGRLHDSATVCLALRHVGCACFDTLSMREAGDLHRQRNADATHNFPYPEPVEGRT